MDDKLNVEEAGLGLNVDQTEVSQEMQENVQAEVQEIIDETVDEELSDEEKKELYIQQLKESKKSYFPIKNDVETVITYDTITDNLGRERKIKTKTKNTLTNITVNKFDKSYKNKRKNKNKLTKASRRANRR